LSSLAACLVVVWSIAPSSAETYVYISVGDDKTIAQYTLDLNSGALSNRVDLQVDGSPGCLTISPDKKYLYAAIRSAEQLAGFAIDPKTGKLTPHSKVNAGANAAYVSTDRSGRYLLYASYNAGKVGVHKISVDGKIEPETLQSVPTAKNAHCILTDAENRLAFVPHTGPNRIFQFCFDPAQGLLTPSSEAALLADEGAGPRHIFFHPKQPWAYTSNELGSSVTAYRIDREQGGLVRLQSLSTLPAGFGQQNTCSDVEVTPDGHYVLVGNRGHDSIARYSIDAKTGTLTALGQTPTEKTPRSFNVDPSSQYVIAAGQGSGKLAIYRIGTMGELKLLSTVPVGKSPSWVQTLRLGD
jgi:6-phosphogluconolactonase